MGNQILFILKVVLGIEETHGKLAQTAKSSPKGEDTSLSNGLKKIALLFSQILLKTLPNTKKEYNHLRY